MFVDVDAASVVVNPDESIGDTMQQASSASGQLGSVGEHLLDVDWTGHCDPQVQLDAWFFVEAKLVQDLSCL